MGLPGFYRARNDWRCGRPTGAAKRSSRAGALGRCQRQIRSTRAPRRSTRPTRTAKRFNSANSAARNTNKSDGVNAKNAGADQHHRRRSRLAGPPGDLHPGQSDLGPHHFWKTRANVLHHIQNRASVRQLISRCGCTSTRRVSWACPIPKPHTQNEPFCPLSFSRGPCTRTACPIYFSPHALNTVV
jgi:hypothetical protein